MYGDDVNVLSRVVIIVADIFILMFFREDICISVVLAFP